MKEAFWGILIVFLGLFGIVIINLFQEVTVGNDEVYYIIKETTEAAMLDGIDMAHYRLTGEIKVIEEKVAENLIRRFAQNITNRRKYTIVIHDINGNPPKISVEVRVNMLGTDITNKVDAIIETKYDLDALLEFLGITEEEWNSRVTIGKEEEKECLITTTNKEYECIPGDVEFVGWEDITLPERACQTDLLNNVTREANYKVCKCGVWEEKREEINAIVKSKEKGIEYTWVFKREAEEDEIRSINESITKTVIKDVCTTGISIMVPTNLTITEPSGDNLQYEKCPAEGIKIPIGNTIMLHGGYIPENASNRNLTWKLNNEGKAILQYFNPSTSTGYSKASIKASGIGTTIVTATSTNNKAATCKVTVWDGLISSLSCEDISVKVGESDVIKLKYGPVDATKMNFEYNVSDENTAKIEGNTITVIKKSSNTTYTVTETNTGFTATCKLTVTGNSQNNTNYNYIKVEQANGSSKYYPNTPEGLDKAISESYNGSTLYKNTGNGENEIGTTETSKSGTTSTQTTTLTDGSKVIITINEMTGEKITTNVNNKDEKESTNNSNTTINNNRGTSNKPAATFCSPRNKQLGNC